MLRPYNDVDLHAFVDGQMSPERRTALAAQLAAAPDDAARVESWKKQNAGIKALFAAPAREPVPLWLTVGQIAAARTGRDDPTPMPRQPRRTPGRLPAQPASASKPQATAAVVALAFAAGLVVASVADRLPAWAGLTSVMAPSPGHGFQQRAWEAHETFGLDADRPVDVTDVTPGRVQAWLDSRVPFRARVPDLRVLGWTLLGGRLAPNDAGPGALLVYRDAAGDRLSLFSGRTGGQVLDGTPTAAEAHGMVAWSDGTIGYALLTSKGRGWLDQNAPGLKQAVLADDPASN